MKQLLALLFLAAAAHAQLPQCNVEGFCDNGVFTGNPSASDANDCLIQCQANGNCLWWTWDPESNAADSECFLWSNDCTAFSTEGSDSDAVSGERTCDPVFECALVGQCQGTFVGDYDDAQSADECLAACKITDGCEWFSYNPDNDDCFFFADCDDQSTTCPDCVSGQVLCENNNFEINFNKMMVVTGQDSIESKNSEIFSVSGTNLNCPTPAFFKEDFILGSYGGFVGGKAVVCGGLLDGNTADPQDTCWVFALNDTNDGTGNDGDGGIGKWEVQTVKLSAERGEGASVKRDDDSIWFTGGFTRDWTTSTEIYTSGALDTITPGPNLPRASGEHCMIRLSNTKFIMLGGFPYSNAVHLYDFETEEWTDLAPMPDSKRAPYCGLVTRDNGAQDIVVAAGTFGGFQTDTWIYSVDNNVWNSNGPKHPFSSTKNGLSVQYGQSFFTFAGDSIDDKRVYRYNEDFNRWDSFNSISMQYDHTFGLAFLIDDSFYDCGE